MRAATLVLVTRVSRAILTSRLKLLITIIMNFLNNAFLTRVATKCVCSALDATVESFIDMKYPVYRYDYEMNNPMAMHSPGETLLRFIQPCELSHSFV